ncbi:Superkiller viralicidic activity 2-like 2 [Strongyloides ratti]|uniref:Superkiller viralicidic activity 2-like 2 n=1 Tax=Strongyloides ratti TaxID=34506 RepID=A0A090L0A6_STRRB|nr:Superkiller viralicidic activity 2-like 2 [Strongyloides ratti]CEF61572.1 Superkiller viralicidic activity 2-like 2 [Strongyloides ratti]
MKDVSSSSVLSSVSTAEEHIEQTVDQKKYDTPINHMSKKNKNASIENTFSNLTLSDSKSKQPKKDKIKMISSAIILNEQNCLHEVFYDESSKPSKIGFKPKHDLRFGYELDKFQVQSNLAVDNNESVLITAHTSAGKTSIARYVINSCLEAKKRCFYTTPLKALSNQKYYDFNKIYNDVLEATLPGICI